MITRTIRTNILLLLLAAIMVFSLLPVTALAATVNSTYTPGTYTGTAKVYKDDVIKVTVTLTEGENGVAISAIDAVLESGDQTDVSFLETAKTAILAQIKAKNGTDNIDAVSGATYSRNGITKGTGANAFSHDATCTRAQAVTLIYRAQ